MSEPGLDSGLKFAAWDAGYFPAHFQRQLPLLQYSNHRQAPSFYKSKVIRLGKHAGGALKGAKATSAKASCLGRIFCLKAPFYQHLSSHTSSATPWNTPKLLRFTLLPPPDSSFVFSTHLPLFLQHCQHRPLWLQTLINNWLGPIFTWSLSQAQFYSSPDLKSSLQSSTGALICFNHPTSTVSNQIPRSCKFQAPTNFLHLIT